MPAETALHTLGPVETDVRHAQQAIDGLWGQTQIETRAYTGNIIALTERKHLARVELALAQLEGLYAGRQIIGLMDGDESLKVQVSLVPQRGLFVERLTLDANSEQLQGAILPLLRPATVNHVWWASDEPPGGRLLNELSEVAEQVIADTLSLDIPPDARYALADLGWSRTAAWREATAQIFDAPDAAAQLANVDHLTVRYAGSKDLPARLYGAWVASTLGWTDLDRVTVQGDPASDRESGDLCFVELAGEGVRFALESQGGEQARSLAQFGSTLRESNIVIPGMTLGEGLARVMSRPERGSVFERALQLAKAQAPGAR